MKQLQVVAAGAQALSPQQKKFNQIVKRIEAARALLAAWEAQLPVYVQGHVARVLPLQQQLADAQLRMLRRLDEWSAVRGGPKQGGWTRPLRQTMSRVICEVAAHLINNERTPPALADELKALHDRHADVDYDEQERESMAMMKTMLETVSGVDLGDEAFESEEALLLHARRRLHEQAEAGAEAADPAETDAWAGMDRRSARAAERRQAKEAQQAQEASQSVREVFRKLASALHPDRADDEADRAHRTAMMQRVNEAYAKNDLLTLFALQLEIEQIDAEHLARATAERAAQYNRVLAEQLQALEAQVQAREIGFRSDFGVDPQRRIDPQRLAALLAQQVATWRGAVAEAESDLRLVQTLPGARRWLEQMRLEHRREDMMGPFGFF